MIESCAEASCAPSPVDLRTASADSDADLVAQPVTARLRVADHPRRLDAWQLVLVARGLQPLLQSVDGRLELHVAPADAAAAMAELDAADAEERHRQRALLADSARETRPATRHAVAGGMFVAVLLVAFFALTGPRAADSVWFAEGASHADQVLRGEWWRTVTALTLHADYAHVLSNVGIGAYAVGAVMRSQGIGFGAALVLASGTLGNLLNAWAQPPFHSSVGFSTAVFGAIGILGGLAFVRGRARAHSLRPAWTALGVSLALFALLGTGGERTDVFAHLFGGIAGAGIGLAVGWSGWRPTSMTGQWLAGLGAAAAIAVAWLAALA